jgi:hypothetical protein
LLSNARFRVLVVALASISMPSFARLPLSQALTQAVTSTLMKLLTDVTGRSVSFGAPKETLPVRRSFNTYSSQEEVTGLRVIPPVIVLLLLTQNRSRAWLTSLASVPGGRVARLNFRKARPIRPFPLKTRRSMPLP